MQNILEHIRAIKDFAYDELWQQVNKIPEQREICARKILKAMDSLTDVKQKLIEISEIIGQQKPT